MTFQEWRATQFYFYSVTDLPFIAKYAWNAALEEAAKVADRFTCVNYPEGFPEECGQTLAKYIRANKESHR